MNNTNCKIIIVDSFMLPLLSIFNSCDIKINVKSNLDLKLPRVKERLKQVGRFHLFDDKALINRLEHTAFNEYDKYYDYVIDNNDNKDVLDNNCCKILKLIK